jgi:hypothetical protein
LTNFGEKVGVLSKANDLIIIWLFIFLQKLASSSLSQKRHYFYQFFSAKMF